MPATHTSLPVHLSPRPVRAAFRRLRADVVNFVLVLGAATPVAYALVASLD
jgi:hypothetical protein